MNESVIMTGRPKGGRAAGQDMFFWPRCSKQGIQFDLPLP